MNRILGFVFFIVLSFSCLGQDSPMMKANFLSNGAPSIDGDILNDPVWQSVDVISDLRQQQPNFGLPASEKTEIRLAYDDKNLYVSAVCFDSQPNSLVVRDARRDASLENTDAFLFVIDTYFDRQNGFMFGTNASGIEYDAQIDNDGCVAADFGIDADVYSDMLQFGNHGGASAIPTYDWFTNPSGGTIGTIDESNASTIEALLLAGGNPAYEARMGDGLSSIKNGQIWPYFHLKNYMYHDYSVYRNAHQNPKMILSFCYAK